MRLGKYVKKVAEIEVRLLTGVKLSAIQVSSSGRSATADGILNPGLSDDGAWLANVRKAPRCLINREEVRGVEVADDVDLRNWEGYVF